MSIQYAILGYLSWQPYSGYDLKKFFEDSAIFHWSGNNNQIYKALVALHEQGMVTLEVQQQTDHPPRKLYSITESGRAVLRQWLLTTPELPQSKSAILVQLAWADQLSAAEVDDLLNRYAEEVQVQVLMLEEHQRRTAVQPQRTPRERYLWQAILQNRLALYQNELTWINQVRHDLAHL
ncbi:MAG: PadR family transcriptional regulator [Anaerolineae bacterium]